MADWGFAKFEDEEEDETEFDSQVYLMYNTVVQYKTNMYVNV